MRSLFQRFDRAGLDYLLISGQASVLYGAATFSEDIDLWIRPTVENARRLLGALAAREGRVYKLTPPLRRRNLLFGHSFHFVIPSAWGPVYLDVLGRPPRVGPYEGALRRARPVHTPWGRIPTVSIADLVELKKTRRLQDYDVISNLVRIALLETAVPRAPLVRWAARNTFRLEDLEDLLRRFPSAARVDRPAIFTLRRGGPPGAAERALAREIAGLQAADRRYWSPIGSDLRALRAAGRLLQEGMAVGRLL